MLYYDANCMQHTCKSAHRIQSVLRDLYFEQDGDGFCGDTDRICEGGKGFFSAGYCPGPNDVQVNIYHPPPAPGGYHSLY